MQLRWTEAAVADLERIAEYLSVHAPDPRASARHADLRGATGAVVIPPPLASREEGTHAGAGALAAAVDRGLRGPRRRRERRPHPAWGAKMALKTDEGDR